MIDKKEIVQAIENGLVFRGSKQNAGMPKVNKIKTKAKKKSYITGLHGSASAKKKADIRRRRANRHTS